MVRELPHYPVSDVLENVVAALDEKRMAVLAAPPGAGKTTILPLRLLDCLWLKEGKIILLEPRRLAARAAARRMADILGEAVGETVGYRMRLDQKISARTRIEVVTEGVFARMIIDDPELRNISAVIFDEFHERSLDADLGLALALETRAAFRDDLRIVVMSATLDTDRIAALLGDAPVIASEGRSFPVEYCYRPRESDKALEESAARIVLENIRNDRGSILLFLPGQREINRTAEILSQLVPEDIVIAPLYGTMSSDQQDLAILPSPAGRRKVVLATSIAETSLTIEGVRIVIDSGLQRLPVFEPSTGITRLETRRASKAATKQRAGRAGRTEPGIAIRMWLEGQNAALDEFTPPEILSADITQFMLDIAAWGVKTPDDLALLDYPPEAAVSEARALLLSLGAIEANGTISDLGKKMRQLALPPRLAAMVITANDKGYGLEAAEIATLLTEQGLGGNSVDIDERLAVFRNDRSERARASRSMARRIVGQLKQREKSEASAGAGRILLHAYPDRIAMQRGRRGRYVLANGRGGEIAETERLARFSFLVVSDMTGRAGAQRILSAASIERSEIESELPDLIKTTEECFFDPSSRQVRARRVVRLGAIVLEEKPIPLASPEKALDALLEGIRTLGLDSLSFSKASSQLRDRLLFLHNKVGEPWPDVSEPVLLETLEHWLAPYVESPKAIDSIRPDQIYQGLSSLIPHEHARDLDKLVPTHFEAPTGSRHAIDYSSTEPTLTIRVQELFGLKVHPSIGGGRVSLLLELTSPAHRPIQTTRDLPGFWQGSWKDVRSEMRGRYPKHPWPEDPAEAQPTSRAKPRGT